MLGSTYGEIAEKLDKTPKAVYNAMGRVKKKIGIFLDGK
jgi:DNA-binding CsgD family transcriptional regulator